MKRKRVTRERRKILQLWNFWRRKKEGFTPKQLVCIVIEIEYLPLRKNAVREFLNRENLVFDDYWRMLSAAQDILEKDVHLHDKFWENCQNICSDDNLVELIIQGETEAAIELFRRIDIRSISSQKAKQVLMVLFRKISDPRSREELWKKIKPLEPNDNELKKLLEISTDALIIKIMDEIQKTITKDRKKKNKGDKILKKLRGLYQEIKKGQE